MGDEIVFQVIVDHDQHRTMVDGESVEVSPRTAKRDAGLAIIRRPYELSRAERATLPRVLHVEIEHVHEAEARMQKFRHAVLIQIFASGCNKDSGASCIFMNDRNANPVHGNRTDLARICRVDRGGRGGVCKISTEGAVNSIGP